MQKKWRQRQWRTKGRHPLSRFSQRLNKKSPQRQRRCGQNDYERRGHHAHEDTHLGWSSSHAGLNSQMFKAKTVAKPSHVRKTQRPVRSVRVNSKQWRWSNCRSPHTPPPAPHWCASHNRLRFSPACVSYDYKIIGLRSCCPPLPSSVLKCRAKLKSNDWFSHALNFYGVKGWKNLNHSRVEIIIKQNLLNENNYH